MKKVGTPKGRPVVQSGMKPKGRPTVSAGSPKIRPSGGCKSCK